jgi:hypothetical protein
LADSCIEPGGGDRLREKIGPSCGASTSEHKDDTFRFFIIAFWKWKWAGYQGKLTFKEVKFL